MLQILETISDAGNPAKPNEDAVGHIGNHAWVIDGATGVGDSELMPAPSDARWLAQTTSTQLTEQATRFGADLSGLLRHVITTLHQSYEAGRSREPNGRYELPSAAMIMVHNDNGVLTCANFADCRLLLLTDDGEFSEYGEKHADRSEKSKARTAALLDKVGEGGDPFALPEVMAHLRKQRNYQNREDGYWILGLDPQAVDHMRSWTIPLTKPVTGLLVSDGFASLAYDYGKLTPAELVAKARDEGLATVVQAIRKYERDDDPHMKIYPRFKCSDDATALLFRSAPSAA
ncbi:MAG: hypothetical protein ACOH12_03730 [Parvibaculaceae bacterium]